MSPLVSEHFCLCVYVVNAEMVKYRLKCKNYFGQRENIEAAIYIFSVFCDVLTPLDAK